VHLIRRGVVLALLALGTSALAAAPAQASLQISSFSLTPSTSQAGGSASKPGPDLAIDAGFSTSNGDSPKDATLSFAPGLVARLNGIPQCTSLAFTLDACPSGSQIGHGYITGTMPLFNFTLSLPLDAYMIQPQGSEAARIGLIVTFFDLPVSTETAPIALRTSPGVGLDIPLTGLPNQLDGIPVAIDGLHLTIFGEVDGAPFTRNPTSCSPASSTLTVDSYGGSTSLVKQSSFTPTGCSGLPYSPTIAGTASKDSSDDGMGLSTTITQQYGEADNQSIDLTLPFSASPRLGALANACTDSTPSTCPAVGSATVQTPLLSQALDAKVVLVAHQGSIPTLAILLPQPFGIELDATPILTGNAVQALVSNIPDLPISSLTLKLPGGPSSLFRAGVHLCSSPQTFSGAFTAWSGATSNPTSPATVTGCPGQTSMRKTADTQVAQMPRLKSRRARPTDSQSRIVVRTRGLQTIVIRLPEVLRVSLRQLPRGIKVILDGRRVAARFAYDRGELRIRLPRSGRIAVVSITPPAVSARRH